MALTTFSHAAACTLTLGGSLQLLQRDLPGQNPVTSPDETPTIGNGRLRIRCPRCQWQPKQNDRWSCTCLHIWNTFDTGGVCPECGVAWQQTQCLRCQRWSRHDDWYVWEKNREKP